MRELCVEDICFTQDDQDRSLLSARLRAGRRRLQVWFRSSPGPVCRGGDPFLPVALLPAMRRGWALRIDGPVSSGLLARAHRAQATLAAWYPTFRTVPITVAEEVHTGQVGGGRGVAAFFSGGVDSFYTVQQHLDEVQQLIFVHGLDLPLGRAKARRRAAASVRSVAESLGLSLVEVETNLRQFGQPYVSWLRAYAGAGLGAVALVLAPRFKKVYAAATLTATWMEPAGSHPDLDPCWSNETMQLVHDGLAATRFDKILAVADWPAAQEHLRVCYQSRDEAPNCGRCRKCLWTMMMLSAAGRLGRVRTFPGELDLRALRRYPPPAAGHQRDYFVQALRLLEQRGGSPELRQALRAALEASGRPPLLGRLMRLIARGRNYLAHRVPTRGARS